MAKVAVGLFRVVREKMKQDKLLTRRGRHGVPNLILEALPAVTEPPSFLKLALSFLNLDASN